MILVALDPGGTTGWAVFEYQPGTTDAKVIDKGQRAFDDIYSLWQDITGKHGKPATVVIEDFALRANKAKAQIGSKFETVQVIGMAKQWAKSCGAQIVMQQPNIKPIAQKFSGVIPPKDHSNSHWVDAFNHGVFYLKKNNLILSRLQETEG